MLLGLCFAYQKMFEEEGREGLFLWPAATVVLFWLWTCWLVEDGTWLSSPLLSDQLFVDSLRSPSASFVFFPPLGGFRLFFVS